MSSYEAKPVTDNVAEKGEITSATADLTYVELYAKYFPALVRVASTRYRSADPEAAAQEVLIKALEKYPTADSKGGVNATWLYRGLRNAVIDEVRRGRRKPVLLETDFSEGERIQYQNTTDPTWSEGFEAVEFNVTLGEMRRVLDARSQKWYDMVFRRIILAEQYNEISEDLEASDGGVKSGVFRSLQALRDDEDFINSLTNND